jgi:hypothetical protein
MPTAADRGVGRQPPTKQRQRERVATRRLPRPNSTAGTRASRPPPSCSFQGRQHQLKTAKLQTLLSQHVTDPRLALRELDRQLSEAIHDLMAAGRGHRLLWVKRGALATVGVGALGIAAQLEPGYQMTWLLAGLSSIAINVATGLSRPRPPGTWAYLHHLHRTFPTAQSPA